MKKRIDSFQILRGVAILLIFLSHCNDLISIDGKNRLMYFGGCGVSIFVALSGFLEAYKYSGVNPPSGMEIYRAKWHKFGWLHLSTLIIAIPLSLSLLRKNLIQWIGTLLLNGILIQSWIPKPSIYFSFNSVSWYLCLVLLFAFLTPVAIKIWKALDVKRTVILSFVILILELLLCLIVQRKSYAHWVVYVFPVTRFFDFLIGGGYYKIAKALQKRNQNNKRLLIFNVLIMAVIGIASAFCMNEYFSTMVWTLPSSVLVALTFIIDDEPASYVTRFLHFIGDISFEFFMIHQLILRYLEVGSLRIGMSKYATYSIALVLSCAFAYFLHNRKEILGKIKHE